MIWFHGIKDSQVESMMAAYEANLANLIRGMGAMSSTRLICRSW